MSCAALLERLPPVWRLDRAESTRRSLKYRRGEGEIVIVNHDGRGWWDPLSEAKGDIFTLVQHLDPGLNFGEARRVLRGFVGDRARVSGGPPRAADAGIAPSRSPQRWEQAPAPVARITGLALPHRTAGIAGDASWWPRARPTPSGKARAAAPGSRTGTARDCLTGIEMRGPD